VAGEIKIVRGKLYPPGWTYDPLYLVEKRLEAIIEELKAK